MSMRKVLLIFPPCASAKLWEPMVAIPLGIGYLAAVARDAGYRVSCLDALVEAPFQRTPVSDEVTRYGLTTDQVMARVRAEEPDLIGLSCIFSNQWPALREIARAIKAWRPDLPMVTGGTHPSFLAETCLRDAPVDYIVIGEGERTFVELLGRLDAGEAVDDLDGLAFRGDDGQARVNPQTRLIPDLDMIPFPAHDLLPVEKYFNAGLPMGYDFLSPRNLPLMTSRGCKARCSFCSSTRHWKRYRARSAENVLAEIDWLERAFGIEEFKIHDDSFTADRARTVAICEGLARREKRIPWNTPNGVAAWTLDRELLTLMKQSGCFGITLGVDSGDQEVVSGQLNKPLSLQKVEEVRGICRELGIVVAAYVIIGFPGETLAQINRTMAFTRRQRFNPNIIFLFQPLPGSRMYDLCLERGYIREEDFFEEGNVFYCSNMNTEEWDAATLERIAYQNVFLNCLRMVDDPYVTFRRYLLYLRHRPGYLSGFTGRASLLVRSFVLGAAGSLLGKR